jgi:mRNA deadenylase 3'-5' endonuclease subunit Ccr4
MAMLAARNTPTTTMEGWTGRIVARILPPDGEGDFEWTQKNPGARIHHPRSELTDATTLLTSDSTKKPMTENLSSFGKDTQEALTTDEVRWTILDVYLSKGEEEEQVHTNRASQELVTNAIQRMELSIAKKLEKTIPPEQVKELKREERKKSKGVETKQTVFVSSNEGPSQSEWNIDGLVNGDFWKQVATTYNPGQVCITVQVHNATIPLSVDSCPPTVTSVRAFDHFEGRVFVGIPLVVDLDLLFATHAIVDWYIGGELVCSDNVMCTPTEQDVGKEVIVSIQPLRPGHDGADYLEAYRFKHTVEERPNNAIMPLRQEWIRKRDRSDNKSLRVMTFNILAHEKAFMDVADDSSGLYPYCDDDIIARSRRAPLILHEIMAYQADVICLQEVDDTSFENLFRPALRLCGYQGFYRKKMGTREGIAMFWDTRHTFEEASENDINSYPIQGLFPKDESEIKEDWKSMYDVYDFLQEDDDLRTILTKKLGHVVQIASLTRKDSSFGPKKVVVSNTHLFFHSKGHHIRLLQLFAICHKLAKERQGYPLLFCGDFNTTPHTGGVRLLLDKHVPPNHHTAWKHLDTFCWETEGHLKEETPNMEERRKPPSVHLADSFPTLKSGYEEFPVFTHYISAFCDTLDYILTSQASETEEYGLVATNSAPMPSKEMIEKNTAMPNKEWPSDHVSLVCDFEFQTAKK